MSAPLVVAVGWLAAGIAAGLQRPVPPGIGPLFIWVAVAGALMALWLAWSPGGRLRKPGIPADRPGPVFRRPTVQGILVLMLGAGLLLGTAVRTASDRSCARWLPEDRPLDLRGTIIGVAPEADGGVTRLRLRLEEVGRAGEWAPCRAEVPARFEGPLEPSAQIGRAITATGRWWTPPSATSLLRRPGTLLLDSARVGERAPGAGPGPGARLRLAGRERVDAIFPRRSALAASLLLAQRDGLDRDVRDQYARAGLSHLLAISGLHVGLIAGILLLVAGAARTSRGPAAGLAAVGTIAYVALLGAPHSAARAALQIVLVLAAVALQRPARAAALIAAAALVLLAADPGAIVEPGFQLSFAGVAGILALRRPLTGHLEWLCRLRIGSRPAGRWLADGLATSVAATVATAPIVAWHFGRVAPVGIVANLVAIPLLGVAVPALALALLAGSVWLPVGRFLGGAAELLLDGLDATAALAASVPFGAVAVPGPKALAWTGAVALGYVAARRLGRVRRGIRMAVAAGCTAAILALAPVRPVGDRVELHVIDVGQGDAIALRSPGGRWLLVDAGLGTNGYDAGARRVVPYLTGRGVGRLEGLVVTHADADHMGGAGAVMAALRPRWVGGPGVPAGKSGYLELLREARAAGIRWVAVRRGVELELDGMRVAVLYPTVADLGVDDANDASVVMRVEYGEFSVLLTGDVPADVEQRLVRRYGDRLESDVLKVGHHGSLTSTTAELLVATGATAAVISAGRGNRYGHPHAAVLARLQHHGIAVYRTDQQGSVVARAGPDGIVRIVTERGRSSG